MEFAGFMERAFPAALAGLLIAGPAIIFMVFLWYFRKTRLTFGRCITCPEKKQRANVQFIARFGEKGPYRDIGSCSLLEGEKKVTCQKACLLSQDVLETPFVAARKQHEAG